MLNAKEKEERLAQIRTVDAELAQLKNWLSVSFFQRPVRYWFGRSILEERINEFSERRFILMDLFLFDTNSDYRKLVESNRSLIADDDVYFKVTSNTLSIMHTHSTRFRGKIMKNGYAYCYVDQGNFPLDPMGSYLFPKRLKGTIDHWGNIRLRVMEKGIDLTENLPVDYQGRITEEGEIFLELNEIESVVFGGGKLMIEKMMANIVAHDRHSLMLFQSNLGELTRLMNEFELTMRVLL